MVRRNIARLRAACYLPAAGEYAAGADGPSANSSVGHVVLNRKYTPREGVMLTTLIPEKSKFALIAVRGAYIQLSSRASPAQLSDGTWVLEQIPVEIDEGWKE